MAMVPAWPLFGLMSISVALGARVGSPVAIKGQKKRMVQAPIACSQTVTGSTVGAPDNLGNPSGEAIYRFCLASSRPVNVSTCGSTFDTFLRIFRAGMTNNETAYCDDCGNCGFQTVLVVDLAGGTCYDIVVEGYDTREGNYTMTVTCGAGTVPMPAPTPATVPMPAPTPAPTPVPATQASSYGDPHITTLQGEKFDILRPGVHTYLVMPRGALQQKAQLLVLGKINPVGPTCGDGLFLQGLKISGSWLGTAGSLEFATMTQQFDTAATVGIKVDGVTTSWSMLQNKLPHGLVNVKRLHPIEHRHRDRHVDTLRVTLQLGPANLTVGWAHIFKPAVNWLWLEVGGIDNTGGLLGSEDHTWATTRPELCEEAKEG